MRILVGGNEWDYVDVGLTDEQAVSIHEVVVKERIRIAEECVEAERKGLESNIAKSELKLLDLKSKCAEIDNKKKRQREELEVFAKKFKVDV